MIISSAVKKMIQFYGNSIHDINHFMKVWCYAKTIGLQEGLGAEMLETLELAAIVHDIACPLCREKYGNTAGPYQEQEGIPLTKAFYQEFHLPEEQLERICYLVGHHHTIDQVDGPDYQILLEADFLVNAEESSYTQTAIETFRQKVFRTKCGTELLNSIYFGG